MPSFMSAAVTKWFCFNIWETIRASNFNIYNNVVHDSLYISTENDATIYFQSAANRTNLPMLGNVRVAISQ